MKDFYNKVFAYYYPKGAAFSEYPYSKKEVSCSSYYPSILSGAPNKCVFCDAVNPDFKNVEADVSPLIMTVCKSCERVICFSIPRKKFLFPFLYHKNWYSKIDRNKNEQEFEYIVRKTLMRKNYIETYSKTYEILLKETVAYLTWEHEKKGDNLKYYY